MYLESFNYNLWNFKKDSNTIEKSLENLSFIRIMEHLLNFFEAFTEFIVKIMLSSFANDLEFFINECKSLKKPYNNYFQKPTFDTWINIGEWLSKSLRRLKNDRDKWELLVEMLEM